MVGYALKWGSPAWVDCEGKVVEERFQRGAFLSAIQEGKVRLCVDHCWDDIVALQSDGSLTLVEDAVGLRIDATANHTDAGDVAMEAVRTRYRAGLSVSFNRPVVDWQDCDAGKLRIITSARLLEVSVCRHPAYRSSEIHAGKLRIERFTSTLPDPRFERLEAAEAAMAKYKESTCQSVN